MNNLVNKEAATIICKVYQEEILTLKLETATLKQQLGVAVELVKYIIEDGHWKIMHDETKTTVDEALKQLTETE